MYTTIESNPDPSHNLDRDPDSFILVYTVCPGSSDPPEKIFNIIASENEVYTIYELLRYFR